jgi:FkbM family methyltransferase
MKKIFWKLFNAIDRRLKFPSLQKGEIGIQLGFDMSAPVTSDLFLMADCVGKTGKVIGIDPDPNNVAVAQAIINTKNLPIQLIHKAVYSEKGTMQLLLGDKASWNQLQIIPLDTGVDFSGKSIAVEMDTLDNILADNNIAPSAIGHINITINGAEYFALKGMEKLLSSAKNLSLTVIAGRYDDSGTINGNPDFKVIKQFLQTLGFTVKFRRIHKLLWWGFIVNTLIKRKWIYGKQNYGVIMAAKGDKKTPWYQSFS